MILNKVTLNFFGCDAYVQVTSSSDDDQIALSVTKLEIDSERSTPDNTFYKDGNTTKVYLGNDEVKSIIRVLETAIAGDAS